MMRLTLIFGFLLSSFLSMLLGMTIAINFIPLFEKDDGTPQYLGTTTVKIQTLETEKRGPSLASNEDENSLPRLQQSARVEPLNIREMLSSCETFTQIPFASVAERVISKENCKKPMSPEQFVCAAQCPVIEGELETTVRIMRTGNHSAHYLVTMCKRKVIPMLVWYSHLENKLRYVYCVPESHVVGPGLWRDSQRLLVMVTCLVQVAMKDFLFGFDASDFSLPTYDAPWDLYHYMSPIPAVLRYVGDSAHNPLLFPTSSHVVATGLCKFRSKDHFWKHCYESPLRRSLSYEQRLKPLMWRGLPTGSAWTPDKWTLMQRMALVRGFGDKSGFDVGFVRDVKRFANDSELLMQLVSSVWVKKQKILKEDHPRHAHLIHVDGNTASWGISHKLSSGSTLIWVASQNGYREHFYHLLKPWVHYIPVAVDLSDLESARDWIIAHPKETAAIGQRALDLVDTRMRPEDLYCYVYRLLASISEAQQPHEDPSRIQFNKDILKQYMGSELFSKFKELRLSEQL